MGFDSRPCLKMRRTEENEKNIMYFRGYKCNYVMPFSKMCWAKVFVKKDSLKMKRFKMEKTLCDCHLRKMRTDKNGGSINKKQDF